MKLSGDVEARAAGSGTVVLGDRYELRRLLGTGGSGAVHLARDLTLHRDVAVKMLRPGQDDLARARLRAEARLAGGLAHPGIARLLDLGESEAPETADGPAPYLVMEYVEGSTLRDVIRTQERLAVEQTLRILAQIADALAMVHAAGIVHRDLKPGNIMLTPAGRAVLLDFGIARHHDGEPLTVTGTIVGTVDYISPEQASGASATAASDIYALGMVTYESLTGLRPLRRDTQVSTLMAHATTPVPSLPPTFPTPVRELVAAMVALEPAARPSAAEVAEWARSLLQEGSAQRTLAVLPMGRGRRRLLPALTGAARRRHAAAAVGAMALAVVAGFALAAKDGNSVAPAVAGVAVTSATPRTSASGTTSPVIPVRTKAPASAVKAQPVALAPKHRRAVRPAPHRLANAAVARGPAKKGPAAHHAHPGHRGHPAHGGHGHGPHRKG